MSIISKIASELGLSELELYSYASSCPFKYKTYKIPKRNSSKTRTISQPSRDLKIVQRLLLDEYLSKCLPVHPRATAYRPNTSIVDNAKPHTNNQYLLKLDFNNFFSSINDTDFRSFLKSLDLNLSPREINFLVLVFFKANNSSKLELSIGSPGSPHISNAMMYKFDTIISDHAERNKVTYTRYSDDMCFTTNVQNELLKWPRIVSQVLQNIEYPNLTINPDKTVFSSKKFNRHITGITISNEGKLSLGRAKKRSLRTQVFMSSQLNSEELLTLKGHLAFAKQVEPEFWSKLFTKYPDKMEVIFPPKKLNVDQD